MIEHLDDATLNALADDTLAGEARGRAESHAATCLRCAGELGALRAVVADLHALPRRVAPARDLLAGINAAIDADGTIPLHPGAPAGGGEGLRARTLWSARWWLAAAGVALVAVSAAVTSLLLRPVPPTFVAVDAATLVPAREFDRVEARFVSATAELEGVLREQRSELAPETIRILEENMAIVDAALEEARQALRADPGNPALSEMLMATYEKKLDLLRSAAASVVT